VNPCCTRRCASGCTSSTCCWIERVANAAEEEDAITLTVHNQGKPIPPEGMPSIFEPLARGPREGTSVGKPYDLDLIVDAVERRIKERHSTGPRAFGQHPGEER
jgi:hypothetical protein